MSDWIVCSDFDGTICVPDSSEHLLRLYATPAWKELDDAVWAGHMTEREAFQRQIALLRISWPEACAALEAGVRIREGFPEFVQWCRSHGLPLVILSSGLRPLIDDLLSRAGISGVPLECHDCLIDTDGWRLIPHRGRRLAEHCSHCKCAHIVDAQAAGRRVVYIGDGYTDLCPAEHADILFATGRLAEACTRKGRPFHPFQTFRDIEHTLASIFPMLTQEISP